jgi:hypothetical protein
MKLPDALKASEYETAEICTEGPTIVIGFNYVDGGYKRILSQSAYASVLEEDGWEPIVEADA